MAAALACILLAVVSLPMVLFFICPVKLPCRYIPYKLVELFDNPIPDIEPIVLLLQFTTPVLLILIP